MLRYLLLLCSSAAILVVLSVLYIAPERLNPQGGQNDSCFSEPLQPVFNGSGMVVSGHHTFCDNVVHDAAIYLYLHEAGGTDSPSSLIFRYADDPNTSPPTIEWKDAHTISISVGDVVQITRLIEFVDGIRIDYDIGREKFHRDAWGSHVRKLKYIFAALAFSLILLAISFVLSIKAIVKNGRGGVR